ncbi:GNAT family N-acetyltransferase [Laceyella putida]|uniref:GNAT family N-acetyltransferase n=1 Tax=Laceyella putida TaxID=110101 RepID=A0ABW2RPY2_9BACL
MIQAPFQIRLATSADHDFIMDLSLRFNDFPLMAWRDRDKMDTAQIRLTKEALENPRPHSELFVIEDARHIPCGYIYLAETEDFFTKEKLAFILAIAVKKEAEGHGLGRKLMDHAEEWAHGRGCRQLGLQVFAANERARRLYESCGFEPESIRMIKDLS